MNRHVYGLMLGIGIMVVATQTAVFSEDKVERRDRQSDKVNSVNGKIVDENAAGVKIKSGGKETLIPPNEIHRVFYDDVPLASKQGYINLWNLEDNEKDQAKVYKAYQDFQPKMTGAPAPVKRNVEYRLVSLQTALAETKEQKAAARLLLQQFVSANPTSWQFPLASRTLARLEIDLGNFDGAQKTLEGIVKLNITPLEMRQEADMMLVDVLFQAGKTDDAKKKIESVAADAKTTEQQKARLSVYSAAIEAKAPNAKLEEVIKNLDGIIAKTSDNAVKGLAYNVMGDCYAAGATKEMKRNAMWSYLWVDVVYNQDRTEHLKAMNSLLKIFEDEKDTEKVQLYKDKISRFR